MRIASSGVSRGRDTSCVERLTLVDQPRPLVETCSFTTVVCPGQFGQVFGGLDLPGVPLAGVRFQSGVVQPQLRMQVGTCPLKHLAQGREIVLHDGFKPLRV
jgi:hypothetical protein